MAAAEAVTTAILSYTAGGAWKEDGPIICETLCGLKLMT